MKKFFIFLLICALCAGFCLPVFAAEPTDDRLLTLVNPWNTIPEDWKVDLIHIGSGHRVDKTCYDDLMIMMEACRAGFCPQPAWTTCPMMTAWTSEAGTRDFSSAPAMAKAPSSTAVKGASWPFSRPCGVRAPPTMTTSDAAASWPAAAWSGRLLMAENPLSSLTVQVWPMRIRFVLGGEHGCSAGTRVRQRNAAGESHVTPQ